MATANIPQLTSPYYVPDVVATLQRVVNFLNTNDPSGSLGSMASQNANAVAITGGTIANINLSSSIVTSTIFQASIVNVSAIIGGTIEGVAINASPITNSPITTATLNGITFQSGTINASTINATSVNASTLTVGTVTATALLTATLNATSLNATSLNVSSINAATGNIATVNVGTITCTSTTLTISPNTTFSGNVSIAGSMFAGALSNVVNRFTVQRTAAPPRLFMYQTDASANNKIWGWSSSDGTHTFDAWDDLAATTVPIYLIGRSAMSPTNFKFAVGVFPNADNTYALGNSTLRWSVVRAVTVTPGDIRMSNEWTITEHDKVGIEESGVAFLNPHNELMMFIGNGGKLYVNETRPLSEITWTKTTHVERTNMCAHFP